MLLELVKDWETSLAWSATLEDTSYARLITQLGPMRVSVLKGDCNKKIEGRHYTKSCSDVLTRVGTPKMKMFSDVHTRVGTPHIQMCPDVHSRVGTPHIEICSDVHTRVGTPHIEMCSDVNTRVGTPHIEFAQMSNLGRGHRT